MCIWENLQNMNIYKRIILLIKNPTDKMLCFIFAFFWFPSSHYFLLMCSNLVVSDSFVAPWTVASQSPLSMGFSRQEYWSGLSFFSRESSQPRDWAQVSCIDRQIVYHWATEDSWIRHILVCVKYEFYFYSSLVFLG